MLASLSATAALSILGVAIVSSWSAFALRSKNTELASVNKTLNSTNLQLEQSVDSLNIANSNLEKSNKDLVESNEEKLRRSQRLEEYVKSVFTQLNRIDVVENPRIRSYKENTLKATLPLIDQLTQELPEGGQADPVKMSALAELAESYREQGMGPEAENAILKAVDIARRRVIVQEGSDASRSNLCLMLSRLSGIRSELSRNIKASREALEEAIAINKEMISDSKSAPNGIGKFPRYRSELSLTDYLYALGVLHYRNGNSKLGLELYEVAIPLLDEVAKKLADKSAFKDITDATKVPKPAEEQMLIAAVQARAANLKRAKAMALSRTGDLVSARTIMLAAQKRLESAYAVDQKNPKLARELAGTEHFLGEIFFFEGQRELSLGHLRRAAELGKSTIEAYPESRELSGSAATFFLSLAQSLQSSDDAEATLWAKRSVKLREEALKTDPTNDRRQLELMLTACRAGGVNKSLEIADKYMAYPNRDVEMLIEIAQAYSVCSTLVPVDQRSSIQEKSIDAITQACRLGFQDWIVLERDIDLEPLRGSGAMDRILKQRNDTE
jgi:tetratricopeptide (TPR) repeat protein